MAISTFWSQQQLEATKADLTQFISLYLFSWTPVTPICISIIVCNGIWKSKKPANQQVIHATTAMERKKLEWFVR